MKKILTFMLFGWLCCTIAVGQQTLYGYRIVPSAKRGIISFSPEMPSVVTQVNTYRDFDAIRNEYMSIVAGEFVKGDFYYSSLYEMWSGAIYPGALVRLNTDNWEVVKLQRYTNLDDLPYYARALDDLSYDFTTNTLYGLIAYETGSYLVTIDRETLEYATPLGNTMILPAIRTMAFDVDGTCYAAGYDNQLYTLNVNTGAVTLVGDMEIDLTTSYRRAMGFNHNTGTLYFAGCNSATDGSLYEIDLHTGKATLKGLIDAGSMVYGLYAPYYENRNIPKAVQNLTATPDAGGGLSAVISWTNPTAARSGNDLSRISQIVIFRNGTLVHTIDNPTPGAAESWTDTSIPSTGDHTYLVYGITDGDDGVRAQVSCVAGHSDCDITVAKFPYSTSFESADDLNCFQMWYLPGANVPGISNAQARTGASSFRFSSREYSDNYTQFLVSPRLAPTTGKKTVHFYYNTLNYETEQFWVGYSTTDSHPDSFTWIDHVDAGSSAQWIEYFNV
ncbi:MAG: hypothetical protein LBS25_10415, partial [Candidatus Symbiothrix sp.]|nr:hypothetical protein [Candidatus Symbiothrix sp.]